MKAINEVEVVPDDFRELLAALLTLAAPGWIFRGLPSYAYSPLSKLERSLTDAGVPPQEWKSRENYGLAFFKERARHYLSELPDERDVLAWLSLMQHYGAPTRLTDWTVSPFVACYYAYESLPRKDGMDREKDDGAALWMLNAVEFSRVWGTQFPFGRDHMGTIRETTFAEGKVISETYPGRDITTDHVALEQNWLLRHAIEMDTNWPLPLPILRPDRRMAAQEACFVCSGKLSDRPGQTAIELFMRTENWEMMKVEMEKISPRGSMTTGHARFNEQGEVIHNCQIPSAVVRKVKLPYEWRTDVLASLAKMNITGDTLFPGLDGVGRATEIYLQVGAPASMRAYLGL